MRGTKRGGIDVPRGVSRCKKGIGKRLRGNSKRRMRESCWERKRGGRRSKGALRFEYSMRFAVNEK